MRVLSQLNSRLKIGTRVSAGLGAILALLVSIGGWIEFYKAERRH